MNTFKQFYSQTMIWIGLAVTVLAVGILAFAFLGSTVNPTPKNMPVALVMEDAGATLPDGTVLNFGKTIGEKLTGSAAAGGSGAIASPGPLMKWTVLPGAEEAAAALDRQDYYAALILPADLTRQLLTLQTSSPKPPQAELLLNQAKNPTGASMVSLALDKTLDAVNGQLRDQLLGELKKRGDTLNTAQASALASPLPVKLTAVNPVPANSANGNAPVTMTQLVWMGALAGCVLQFLTARKAVGGRRSYGLLLGQISSGLLYGAVAVGSILLFAAGFLGLHIPEFWPVAGFLLLAYGSFFLLQSLVVEILGLKGMPILVLLFFFGLPVLSLPYEFLPRVTQEWFYSWVPFRFSVEGLRDLFYFRKGLNWAEPAGILSAIGLAAFLGLLVSPLGARNRVALENGRVSAGESSGRRSG